MKKIFLMMIVCTMLITCSFAEGEVVTNESNQTTTNGLTIAAPSTEQVNNAIGTVGDGVKNIGQTILDKISSWSLPICALLVVWGSVQYFILGIRNLYKKRQGLLLIWGSITFYVITLFASLIFSFMSGQ